VILLDLAPFLNLKINEKAIQNTFD